MSAPEDATPGAGDLGARAELGAFGYQMAGDKILVRKVDRNMRTAGGIILPPSAVSAGAGRNTILATVEAVGPGRKIIDNDSGDDWNGGRRVPSAFTAGQTVLLARWGGHTGLFGLDDSYAICTEGDVLCVIDGVDVVEEDGHAVAPVEPALTGNGQGVAESFSYGHAAGYDVGAS